MPLLGCGSSPGLIFPVGLRDHQGFGYHLVAADSVWRFADYPVRCSTPPAATTLTLLNSQWLTSTHRYLALPWLFRSRCLLARVVPRRAGQSGPAMVRIDSTCRDESVERNNRIASYHRRSNRMDMGSLTLLLKMRWVPDLLSGSADPDFA